MQNRIISYFLILLIVFSFSILIVKAIISPNAPDYPKENLIPGISIGDVGTQEYLGLLFDSILIRPESNLDKYNTNLESNQENFTNFFGEIKKDSEYQLKGYIIQFNEPPVVVKEKELAEQALRNENFGLKTVYGVVNIILPKKLEISVGSNLEDKKSILKKEIKEEHELVKSSILKK